MNTQPNFKEFIVYMKLAGGIHQKVWAIDKEEAMTQCDFKHLAVFAEEGDKPTFRFDCEKEEWVKREEEKKEIELNESILSDDYPVYAGYLYVADGKVISSDWHGINIGQLKKKLGVKEIRNCDIFGRQAQKKTA